MIPSVIGAQVRRGIEEFLRTTFPITNPFFDGALENLLARPGEVFRGPYVSLKLPFQPSHGQQRFFTDTLPRSFHPFRHQELAWERLDWRAAKNTIVATGTGSGKTECFLYPILDYCYQHRNERGIKAILIYPMNALATDQAGRIAEAIFASDALRGKVTAGLYVGEEDRAPQVAMTESRVITHKDSMRQAPPDILLTNYKMLDYLLLRPDDLPLWRKNLPETLRYLVIDELHTFDGAQGADVACLIRRIKSRLKTPEKHLICVGTSATLGGNGDTARSTLAAYAARVFGEPFEAEGVIGEEIQKPEEFLAGERVLYAGIPGPDAVEVLDPLRYESQQKYLEEQRRLWFGISASVVGSDKWKLELGQQLRAHSLFRRLLAVAGGEAAEVATLLQRISATVPGLAQADARYLELVLASFLALISEARAAGEKGPRPLLDVRYQFWMRELARVVSSVRPQPKLAFASDLKTEDLRHSLPVVHCRECGLTGWAGTVPDAAELINPDLDTFYRAFFDRKAEVQFFFPGEDLNPSDQFERPTWLCPQCLHFKTSDAARDCSWCGKSAADLIRVWMPASTRRREAADGTAWRESHNNCPACNAHNSLTVVGSRAASLTAVLISQLFASPFNPGDKKLLAFSDNVQDASHRAGFFKARTFRFNLRAAIQKVVQAAEGPIPFTELSQRFLDSWQAQCGRREQFVANFLPPDMEWLEDYETLRRTGNLAADSPLLPWLCKRLKWELWSEYTHNARIGRSLEKTGSSVVDVAPEMLSEAAEAVTLRLQNEVGELRELDTDSVRAFLAGFIINLKNRGGVWHDELQQYIGDLGNSYVLTNVGERKMYMPRYSPWQRLPEFLIPSAMGKSRFLVLASSSASAPSWHTQWLKRSFGKFDPNIGQFTDAAYRGVLKELVSHGILFEITAKGVQVWGIKQECLRITEVVRQLRCDRCSFMISAGADIAAILSATHCPHITCRSGILREQSKADDYYGRLYRAGEVARIFATEHTGLLTREVRETVETGFEKREKPGDPNLLSCTPTLEMGVDIGDLESVALCSVPPKTSNYLQRAGRAGRKHGNAFVATVANARPHDLFFFVRPDEMLAGKVETPGCFLDASAVLERQFTAFVLDRWVETGLPPGALPQKIAQVLDSVERGGPAEAFPWNYLGYFDLHRTDLEEQFLVLFGTDISDSTRERLLEFSRNEDGLRYRLVEGLRRRAEELKKWRGRIQTLNKRIRELQDVPMTEEERRKEEDELRQEKSALQQLANDLRDLPILHFLTNEGLLPNYAFPEQGVTLQSIIYRRKEKEADPERRFETHTYKYDRPAAAAIAELAPENRFYAEGRKVQVDGVIFEPEDLEPWRLCPNCSWMEREGEREPQTACPKCGHTLWSDDGQRKVLLRMRQVIANTSDRESRSLDDDDQREPKFYEKNMFVLTDGEEITQAFFLDHEELPFGFEFFRKLTLREVNLGELGAGGARMMIAGRERSARSFELCQACGKIRRNGEIHHTPWCRYRKEPEKEKAVRACYLYREFSSEAIRMLLPVSVVDAERQVESFVAALELGLRKKFQGDPGHLHTTVYDEPIQGTEARKRYLVLYDGVPGGTGYLKTLMAAPSQLEEVFRSAHDALVSCDCRLDESKDGCYACLLAYRGRHFQGRTSRATALELLSQILTNWQRLKVTDRLDSIRLNRLLESELEAAFLEALQRKNADEPERRLEPRVINGKKGYYLTTQQHGNWTIEPQVDLGPDKNVRIPSRADFVMYPERPYGAELPIAIFTDGYEWHADAVSGSLRTGRDSAQRLAILRSGKYRVWSLTWADVYQRLDKAPEPQADLLSAKRLGATTSLDLLISLLTIRRQDGLFALARDIAMDALVANRRTGVSKEELASALSATGPLRWYAAESKAATQTEAKPTESYCGVLTSDYAVGFVAVPHADVADASFRRLQIWLRLLDDRAATDGVEWRRAWRDFLRGCNILQFLPGAAWMTTIGLLEGIYGSLLEFCPAKEARPSNAAIEILLADVVDENARKVVIAVDESALVLPVAGFEIADGDGEIVAFAELAWPELKVCVLTQSQEEFAGTVRNAGWQVWSVSDLTTTPETLFAVLPKRSTT
jgi:DEAD/DEAH box helicase domain-containing protein